MAKKIVGFFSGEELEQMGGTKKLCNQPSSLYLGNSEDILKTFPDNSVDSIVTDPPYGLRFMGKRWDYDVPSVVLWSEVFRVLKPGGHLLSFGGTRTYHRMVVNIEDAGWEIRDTLMWVYGSGFPKSLNIGKAVDKLQGNERKPYERPDFVARSNKLPQRQSQVICGEKGKYSIGTSEWEGWGTALKPAYEPIIMARKPIEGTVAENVLKWGTGGINVDGCRVEVNPAVDDMLRTVTRKSRESQTWEQGSGFKNENNPHTGVPPQGRFPANFIHDGSDEVVGIFPVTAPSKASPRNNGAFKSVAKGRELPHTTTGHDDGGGSAARFFYCAKASRSERGEGNNHPTVKPLKLMEYLVRLVTPPGGIVLDPFMGSGTTGLACRNQGFKFVGIEKDPSSFEIAKRRIEGS